MSDSMPHRRQPTRLPRPWDSPGKNTGVGSHFPLHIIINSMDTNLSFTISWNWLRFVSNELMMISNHLILCFPLFLLPSVFPSIRGFPVRWVFPSGGQSIEASAFAAVLPMNIQDWFPLRLTVLISLQSKGGTLKGLLQHHNLKASILWCSAFCMV